MPKKQSMDGVVFVRAPKELVKKLDARLVEERKRRPGHSISRADLVRELLNRALEE